MKNGIYHVCNSRAAKGSRIHAQQLMAPGELVIENNIWPSYQLARILELTSQSAFIFHQQVMLPSLIFTVLLCKLAKKSTLLFTICMILPNLIQECGLQD
jgi:hypothetical protein